MTFPRPAAFPGGRVLAGWWKQLAPWRPQSLWLGSLILERTEALCSIRHSAPLPPLDSHLLKTLSERQATDISVLTRRLGVTDVLLTRLLIKLEQKRIVGRSASGWQLTEAGAEARRQNLLPGERLERRSFWFLCDPQDSGKAAFVNPAQPGAFQPVEANRIHRGSLEALLQSSRRDAEWKRQRAFPLEIDSIIVPESSATNDDLAAWEKVVVVHPHWLQAALIAYVRESGQPGVAAFSYQEHGWALGALPVFDLAASWKEIFPGLPVEPDEATITEAWRKWLNQRGLASQALERCQLVRRDGRIGVISLEQAPDIVGGPRGDLARGEAWLVLYEGPLKRVMPLEAQPLTKTANQG
jgi:hypothetical protein